MGISMDICMDIRMNIHEKKSVDMDVDMDGKFHIHGKPAHLYYGLRQRKGMEWNGKRRGGMEKEGGEGGDRRCRKSCLR